MFHHIRGLERACKVVVAVPSLDVRAQLESKFHWKVCYRRLDFIIFSRDSGSRCHVPASLRSGESITTPCRRSSSQFHAGLDVVSGAAVFVIMDISARLRGLDFNPSSLFFPRLLSQPCSTTTEAWNLLGRSLLPCHRWMFVKRHARGQVSSLEDVLLFYFASLSPSKQASLLACLLGDGTNLLLPRLARQN